MEFTLTTLVLLPLGLGLFGFLEPCTIGGHLVFLDTQAGRSRRQKVSAVLVFIAARAMLTGLFGAALGALGAVLIDAQTWLWIGFGVVYLLIGLAFLARSTGRMRRRIRLAPETWRHARNPVVLGLAFGLSIPACAAPILFGLIGLAATTGSILAGFGMMALFGLGLSLPLLGIALVPRLANALTRLGQKMKGKGWILGLIFVALGLWSIWFGLYVNPADWSGR